MTAQVPLDQLHLLPQRAVQNFNIGSFSILAESYETTWGVKNGADKNFKLSNADLLNAFDQILANWDEWEAQQLNQNNVNPDKTVYQFAETYFNNGAHRDLAMVQRRGFLHLISAVVYSANHLGEFNKEASSTPLTKEEYQYAREIVHSLSQESAAITGTKSELMDEDQTTPKSSEAGINKIFYGAPGTGKSFAVDELVGKVNVVRTVFHPDTQNSDFFGCLKPTMDGDRVTYKFAPGPFSRVLRAALHDPDKQYFLVIEELNRAPAAAVFGELFQLLDRNDNGDGKYKVDFPNPESENWFAEEGSSVTQLQMPSNLSIYATMNSADQGVYPLDTAFRRRWEQKYVPLYAGDGPTGKIQFIGQSGEPWLIPWHSFVESLNDLLVQKFDVAEDRLLGLWFVKSGELGQSVPSKILLYLWDDLLRHENRVLLFSKDIKTFGELDKALEDNQRIFDAAFLEELEKWSVPVEVKSPEDIVEPVSSD